MKIQLAVAAFVCLSFVATACNKSSGCTKDTDCKGSRVCQNGQCVAPAASASTSPAAEATSAPAESPSAIAAAAASAALAAQEHDREAAKAHEREALLTTPWKYVSATNPQYYNKGWIHSYRTLSSVTITNHSRFSVDDIAGKVTWLDSSGKDLGTLPFTISGTVSRGQTETFAPPKIASGTIQSSATKARVIVTKVHVL